MLQRNHPPKSGGKGFRRPQVLKRNKQHKPHTPTTLRIPPELNGITFPPEAVKVIAVVVRLKEMERELVEMLDGVSLLGSSAQTVSDWFFHLSADFWDVAWTQINRNNPRIERMVQRLAEKAKDTSEEKGQVQQ